MEGGKLRAQYESSVKKFLVQFDISDDSTPDWQDLMYTYIKL